MINVLLDIESSAFKGLIFLALVGITFIVALVLLFAAIRDQIKHNNSSLPEIEGLVVSEPDDYEEESARSGSSAFALVDDELDEGDSVNSQSEELLISARKNQKALEQKPKKVKIRPFRRKTSE